MHGRASGASSMFELAVLPSELWAESLLTCLLDYVVAVPQLSVTGAMPG